MLNLTGWAAESDSMVFFYFLKLVSVVVAITHGASGSCVPFILVP